MGCGVGVTLWGARCGAWVNFKEKTLVWVNVRQAYEVSGWSWEHFACDVRMQLALWHSFIFRPQSTTSLPPHSTSYVIVLPCSQHFSINALFTSRVVSVLSSTTTRDTSQTLPSVRDSRMSRPSGAGPSARGSVMSRPSETEDSRPSGQPQPIKQTWSRGGGRQSGGMAVDATAAGSSLPAADTAAAAESPALFTTTLTRRVPGRRSTTATLFQRRVQSGAQNIRTSMEQVVADQASTPSAYGSRHSAFGRQVSILKIGSDGAERYSLDSIAGGTPIHAVWDEETRMLAMQVGGAKGGSSGSRRQWIMQAQIDVCTG